MFFCCILLWFSTSRKWDYLRKQSSEINPWDVNLGVVYFGVDKIEKLS